MILYTKAHYELMERNEARVKEAIQKLGSKYAHHPDNYVRKLTRQGQDLPSNLEVDLQIGLGEY